MRGHQAALLPGERGLSGSGEFLLALLLCGLAFVLLYRIGDAPAANPAEARVEAVVQEMVDGGDWLVPRIDGQPRLHKPPGYYWVAAALSRLAGGPDWAPIRAGSALAALVMVALTFAWGRKLGGPALGLLAALCLASMQFTVSFGRRGVAEMMLAACSTLALAGFERLRFERRSTALGALGAGLVGAILAKATAALLFVGVPIGLQLALDGRGREPAARRVLMVIGAACVAGFLWYPIVLLRVPGAAHVFASEALLPLGVQIDGSASALHYSAPTKYLSALIMGMLPASLFLPLALGRGWRTRGWVDQPRWRFVARSAISLLAVLALIPQKQRHYLLPLLPLFALLIAEAIVELHARAPQRLRAALLLGVGVLVPLGLAALVALSCFWGEFLGLPSPRRALLLVGGGALLGALAWTAVRRPLSALAPIAAAASLSAMLGWFGVIGLWRSRFEAGTATATPEYQATRWRAAAERHPWIERFVRADADRG